MTKVLIIGIDGGTFDLIKPWVGEGKLPNIARLMSSGTYGNLRTTIPPMTFPAWNAFMTGKNPGKHGVFDFMERKQGSYQLEIMNAKHRKSETIWRIASKSGGKCAVISVPVTYPPEELNGIMISGFDAPFSDKRITYPNELFQELEENVGKYVNFANIMKHLRVGHIDKALDALLFTIDRKAETAKYILKREPWDLFMLLFGETDSAIHHFWKYHDKNSPQRSKDLDKNLTFDPIYEVYNKVDKKIGEILEITSDETTVILMSDHGAGGAGNKVVHLNRFLEIHDLLRFKNSHVKTHIHRRLEGLKSYIRILFPRKWLKFLSFSPKGMGLKWESKIRFSSIDWAHTKVYSEETPHYPNLRINLKGREPDGIVEKSDYQDIVKKTISLLNEWRDPETGNKVVKKAYTKEELYHGDYVDKAPDIIISWDMDKGYSYLSRPSFMSKNGLHIEKLSERFVEMSDYMLNRSGSHRDEGIFIIAGKQIKTNANIDNVEIIDIAPTILYLLDVPIPNDMDGKVLLGCFKKDYIRKPVFKDVAISKIKPGYNYTDEETDEVKKKLKGLGYL